VKGQLSAETVARNRVIVMRQYDKSAQMAITTRREPETRVSPYSRRPYTRGQSVDSTFPAGSFQTSCSQLKSMACSMTNVTLLLAGAAVLCVAVSVEASASGEQAARTVLAECLALPDNQPGMTKCIRDSDCSYWKLPELVLEPHEPVTSTCTWHVDRLLHGIDCSSDEV
jgi:hypothetical protein